MRIYNYDITPVTSCYWDKHHTIPLDVKFGDRIIVLLNAICINNNINKQNKQTNKLNKQTNTFKRLLLASEYMVNQSTQLSH